MLSPLIQKLDSLEPLSGDAKAHLRRLGGRVVQFAPREDMVRESEPRGDVRILVEGVGIRYKALDGGHQAVLGFFLPGDADETDSFVEQLDHGIAAVTACRIVQVPRAAFDQLLLDSPEIARAFRRMARLEETIRRVWLANMGQRAADKQTAHLLCELRDRLSAAGMGGPDWFTNPFTQEQLSHVLGISPVHMNRVMQHLRESGLVRVDGHLVRFPSLAAIRQYAEFDEAYLRGSSPARTPAAEKE